MNSIDINRDNIAFHDKLPEMPMSALKTEITEDILNGYVITFLDIDKVLNHIHNGNIYKKFVLDNKMTELVQFIREGNLLIPPIIRNISNNNWTILDGQHRIGLAYHLGIMTIPFLIRKDQIKYINNLK